MMRARPLAILVALAALAGPAAAQTPTASVWQASSGLLPTQVCPAWTVTDTSASDPILGPTGLTISDATGEDLFYSQTDALDVVPVPNPIVVEARMRFVSGTSSTTLPSPDCGDNVPPGTVNTVRCRLGVLADQVAAANGLGQFRAKLQSTLTQASGRVDQAVSACETGDDKTASRRMKQTAKFLQKMTHRLSGLPARKKIDAGLRADLIRVIESIRGDVGSLRKRPCGTS